MASSGSARNTPPQNSPLAAPVNFKGDRQSKSDLASKWMDIFIRQDRIGTKHSPWSLKVAWKVEFGGPAPVWDCSAFDVQPDHNTDRLVAAPDTTNSYFCIICTTVTLKTTEGNQSTTYRACFILQIIFNNCQKNAPRNFIVFSTPYLGRVWAAGWFFKWKWQSARLHNKAYQKALLGLNSVKKHPV